MHSKDRIRQGNEHYVRVCEIETERRVQRVPYVRPVGHTDNFVHGGWGLAMKHFEWKKTLGGKNSPSCATTAR